MAGDHVKRIGELFKALRTVVVALVLTLLICYAANAQSVALFAIIFCISVVATYSMGLMLQNNALAYDRKEQRESLADYLYRVLYYKSNGGSYLKSLSVAVGSVSSPRLANSINESIRKYIMASAQPSNNNYSQLDTEVIEHGEKQIRDSMVNYDLYLDSRQVEIAETTQRYATFNMFISTILPSFLVFAFIGNAILSEASSSMLLLSVLLLFIIPIAYSAGNFLMWGRLFA